LQGHWQTLTYRREGERLSAEMASGWLQSIRQVARWCHMLQTQRRAVTHTPTGCQSCQDLIWPQDVWTQT
jgi:hypothetical protein